MCICNSPFNKKTTYTPFLFLEMAAYTISVVADDEIRLKTNEGTYIQKLVHEKVGQNPEVYWTSQWVREIVSYMTECVYLQKRYPKFVEHLAWTAYSPVNMPQHADLVRSLRMLLTVWLKDCVESETCIAPPSRAMLADRELRKMLKKYKVYYDEHMEANPEEKEQDRSRWQAQRRGRRRRRVNMWNCFIDYFLRHCGQPGEPTRCGK